MERSGPLGRIFASLETTVRVEREADVASVLAHTQDAGREKDIQQEKAEVDDGAHPSHLDGRLLEVAKLCKRGDTQKVKIRKAGEEGGKVGR